MANHTKYTSGKATIAQPLHEYIVIKKQLANHSYLTYIPERILYGIIPSIFRNLFILV